MLSYTGRKPFAVFSRAKTEMDALILKARRERDPDAVPLPDWRLHDLRRTAATGMQRLGVRLEVTEAVLGHVSGSHAGIVGIYQRHSFEHEAREAVALWAAHVQRLLGG